MWTSLEDIALFRIKTLSQWSHEDTVAHMQEIGDPFASGAPTQQASALQDMEQGKTRLEVEETLGYAVHQAGAHGVPAPTIATCYNLIASIHRFLESLYLRPGQLQQ